ncbi:MAG: response regulator [Pseudomonadota bacterium]
MGSSILVVDDSKLARLMVTNLIVERWPQAQIEEAESADEAFLAIEKNIPDHVIIDHNMPGMDGLDLARQLRDVAPQASLTLLTANIQVSIREQAEALGCRFIAKPVNEEKISDLLAELGD